MLTDVQQDDLASSMACVASGQARGIPFCSVFNFCVVTLLVGRPRRPLSNAPIPSTS